MRYSLPPGIEPGSRALWVVTSSHTDHYTTEDFQVWTPVVGLGFGVTDWLTEPLKSGAKFWSHLWVRDHLLKQDQDIIGTKEDEGAYCNLEYVGKFRIVLL